MERIPYPPADSYPPELPDANMLRMWAHSPSTLRPGLALGTACISSVTLSGLFREILALYCSVKFKCDYIWARHVNGAKRAGLTDSQIQALQDRDIQNDQIWGEKEIAFLTFLDEVIDYPEARDDTFSAALKYFDNRQVVEILTSQGFYFMWARLATTLRVEVDAGVQGDYQKAKQWANESN